MVITILEDEFFIARNLERIIRDRGYHAQMYQSPAMILDAFKAKGRVSQLVLIDVNLNDKLDGVEVARMLRNSYGCDFIFITALSDATTLERIMDLSPLAYIVKPFTDREVLINLEIAISKIKQNEELMPPDDSGMIDVTFIRTSDGLIKLNLREIRFVEAYDNYIKIHTKGKTLITKSALKDFADKTQRNYLLQIHRSYIVNINAIHAIFGNMVMLDSRQLPIGKTYRQQLDKFILN